MRFGLRHHRLEVGPRLPEGATLGRDITVMEAEERHPELADELERCIELGARRNHRLQARIQPWAIECTDTEDIGARPVEGVPQTDRDAEVVLHALAKDESIRLVDAERDWVRGVDSAESNAVSHLREEAVLHQRSSFRGAARMPPPCRSSVARVSLAERHLGCPSEERRARLRSETARD